MIPLSSVVDVKDPGDVKGVMDADLFGEDADVDGDGVEEAGGIVDVGEGINDVGKGGKCE